MYIYIYIYICMCICIHIHIHTVLYVGFSARSALAATIHPAICDGRPPFVNVYSLRT